jgi:hypothetical protein
MEYIECKISKSLLEEPYGHFVLKSKLRAAGFDISQPYEWSDDISFKTNERVYKQMKGGADAGTR